MPVFVSKDKGDSSQSLSKKFILYDKTRSLTPNLTWAVDYPIIAYKSVSPDNREIVLVHLARKIP